MSMRTSILNRMSRPSHKETILTHGLALIHKRGFSHASVRDITAAANVPNGSFTNHFASKEEFGLAVLDIYVGNGAELMARTVLDTSRPPLERLIAYVDESIAGLEQVGVENGCLIGNFSAESDSASPAIRQRVAEIFKYRCASVAACIREAVSRGEVRADINCDDVGVFIIGSLQGATLLARSQHSMEPMRQVRRTLVDVVLR